jgi:hypothetical protein
MNKTARILSLIAVAAFTSFGAQADEADASQFATQFTSQRTRAEVQAEAQAQAISDVKNIEPAGSRVVTYSSTADRSAVRAGAVDTARNHSIEPAGSRVTTYTSTADRAAVRAEAAQAIRYSAAVPAAQRS